MIDTNNFNIQDYTQGQTIDFGSNQVFSTTEGTTQIDPSTYLQGDTAVLQASAGLENISSGNVDYFSQNNTYQPTSYDTNAIFGENVQITNETPQTYGQTIEGTTTTNVIDGNNYFGDTNALLSNTTTNQIQGTNIDINSYKCCYNFIVSLFNNQDIIPNNNNFIRSRTRRNCQKGNFG